MIENHNQNPFAVSESMGYNALDFALYAKQTENVNVWLLVDYLRWRGLEESAPVAGKRRRR